MRSFGGAFTRRKLVAITAGVLLAGAPMVTFNMWVDYVIERQGAAEVSSASRRAASLADARLNEVIKKLGELAEQGVSSCRPSDVEAMRQAAFGTSPIKEVAIVGPDGSTLCTHFGMPLGQRQILSSEPLAGAEGYSLDVVKIADSAPMVRLRHTAGLGISGIAALVPVALLLPQISIDGSPFSAYAQIATPEGFLIGAVGERPSKSDMRFQETAKSDRLGLVSTIEVPRDMVPARQSGLKALGMVGTGIIVLILIGLAILLPRRRGSGNPVADIEAALIAGEFVPYYQPIVDIRSGQLRGAEVLVRWKKPDGTLVYPGSFIPLAESSGLIREMTRDLMRRVCVEAGEAIGRRPGLKISFNFAGKLFSEGSIVKDVVTIFSNSPIKLAQVVLEVTERDPIENFTATRQTIAAFQGLGVRIAIDDVGTGHSGLSYMLKLGVDIIKIDKMFVDAIGTDRNSTTIVETLVDLAHNMRMDVVAEGVENFEQVMHLRDLGIRSAQGYVFAPPLPGSAFLQLVEALEPLPAVVPKSAPRSRFSAA
ncbi:MAG: EAL domain-containing protein [Pseudolabrys sp.]